MASKYPPLLTLEEAISVIQKMFDKHNGEEVAIDDMPEIFGVKQSSSYFPMKISALQKYGLVRKGANDMLMMTDVAMQIVNPMRTTERVQGIISLFQNSEIVSDFYTKYGKTTLPSPEQIKMSLNKNYGIERDKVEKWYDYVADSFKALNLIESIPHNKSIQSSYESLNTSQGEPPNWGSNVSLQNIQLPSGGKFEFTFPSNGTTADVDFILGFFELKKKTIK